MKTLIIAACAAGLLALGCSKPQSSPSDSVALQGAWSARDVGTNGTGRTSLVVSGTNLDFRGADTNVWFKATFTLREDASPKQLFATITQCQEPQFVGKIANAIYKLQDGTFTFTANEPGDPAMPKGFNTPDADTLVFQRK